MNKENKNTSESNDATYVKKPKIHYSYKFQPYVRDLGGSPGKNMTQEDRNKRLRFENNINAVRNVVRGLNNTFGTAISGASLFYGGGWALNRLLHLNKASNLGQFFGKYALPANTADNVSDGVELIFDPSVKGAVDLGTGVVLGKFKDLSKPVRQVGELVGLGANVNNMKNGGQVRKMLTAAGGPINWLRKRIYTNIEPFGYNNIGSRLYNGIILNENEHNNFKGDYSDIERAPALYLTIDNIWGEYLHIPEKERRYSNGKYKIKNNGNGTFSLPFKSMEDIMLTVNSNNPLLWGLRGKAINSVVGEYDIYRGYDKNGDYLKYIDHWRINPYDVKEDKEYGLDNNSLLKRYFKGKDDASFGLGTPVEIQGKYYLDDIYNIKGKDRGGHYLPEVIVTGKKKQGGKMNILEFLKNGSGIHIKKKNKGKFTSYCGGKVTDECILKGKNSSNPAIRKRATFAANARKWKHKEGGSIEKLEKGSWIKNSLSFLNESGLGKTLLEGGLSFLLSGSQNKSIAGATDIAKAELDKEGQEASDYALLMATKKALEMLLIDPNNPNAFGGSIVLNYILQLLYNEYLNSIKLNIANRKALLDMLSLQMLNENTSGAISGIIQSGLGVVGNLLGGKKNNSPSNVPSSTTITGTPSSSKLVVTTKSGMSGTVDLWRKAMQV